MTGKKPKWEKGLDPFQRNQLDIARKTLKMPDAILGVMGGMTKAEARSIIARLKRKNNPAPKKKTTTATKKKTTKTKKKNGGTKHYPRSIFAKKHEILADHEKGNQVAYLKRQEDGRYTVNAGHILDSGYDNWFSTQATSDKDAKAAFSEFKKIWFSAKVDPIDRFDMLSDMDFYSLDEDELEKKGYY